MTKISKKDRDLIKQKFGGFCAYCGCELGASFHVDHVEAIYRDKAKIHGMLKPENHVMEKLYPACKPCNLFKSVLTVEAFRQEISMQAERAEKYSVNHRTAKRFGQITHTPKPIVFWFEQYAKNTEDV